MGPPNATHMTQVRRTNGSYGSPRREPYGHSTSEKWKIHLYPDPYKYSFAWLLTLLSTNLPEKSARSKRAATVIKQAFRAKGACQKKAFLMVSREPC